MRSESQRLRISNLPTAVLKSVITVPVRSNYHPSARRSPERRATGCPSAYEATAQRVSAARRHFAERERRGAINHPSLGWMPVKKKYWWRRQPQSSGSNSSRRDSHSLRPTKLAEGRTHASPALRLFKEKTTRSSMQGPRPPPLLPPIQTPGQRLPATPLPCFFPCTA
ncbi:hypothetical protein E2562_030057 [Oryza meyeriana var. granulata]|uniref:Uncharacterized protein n=1 Tax=Oryza meyeriana var. granulata TaxID=110450 RepID=A0A6G1CV00_9ORYZ|nr:hypothetical protein E2562_030057 [Oryza meyeriana var. granulata]